MQEFSSEATKQWLANQEQRVSSATLAMYTDDDRVLVVKANYKRYWSFPGGIVDRGESPLEAAVRESSEETGIQVKPEALEFRLVVDRISPIAQTYQFVFQAKIEPSVFDSIVSEISEIEDYAVVSRQQIIDGDRYYSQSAKLWAAGFNGYSEQTFGAGMQADI